MAESRALSQWEIDALLNQMPDSDGSEESDADAAASGGERGFTRVIRSYDFRRPDKFSKEQWRTLQSMHDTLARLVGAAFSSRLRTLVSVRLSSIDQGLYEEWQSQVPSQTICYVLSMQPLAGNIVVEFNSDVAIEVIDRLLGGSGTLLEQGRDLGEIELALLRSFSRTLLTSLEEMWSAVAPVKPELQDLGLDAGVIQIANANDVVISAFFEVNVGDHLGAMSICVPYTVLESIVGKLSTQLWHGSGAGARPTARSRRRIEALLGGAPAGISVELGGADLPVRLLTQMTEGNTLLLDARADRPLTMLVEGIPRFRCRPGLIGNRVSVRVTEMIEDAVQDSEQDSDADSIRTLLEPPETAAESAPPDGDAGSAATHQQEAAVA